MSRVPPCRCLPVAPATTVVYTLSLHDALPISAASAAAEKLFGAVGCDTGQDHFGERAVQHCAQPTTATAAEQCWTRSEEHTSELQSRQYLVCRPLLGKKKNTE